MNVVERFGGIDPDTGPSTVSLRDAHLLNLGRHPETQKAKAFVAGSMPLLLPHMGRGRLGRAGLASLADDLGVVLAGIVRPGLQGVPVRAQASSSGSMWDGAPMGCVRFWRIVDALQAAGLVQTLRGIKTPLTFAGYGGLATAVWPTGNLIDRAESHGCIADTRKADWRTSASTVPLGRALSDAALVTCRPVNGVPLPASPTTAITLATLALDLRAINATNEAASIRGVGHSVTMVRRFLHSPLLGGRFYAPHVTMAPEDRARITIGGSRVVEVDIKASQLSILMGLTGERELPADPYAFEGIPRAAVKRFVLQTLGGGKPAGAWSGERGGSVPWPSTGAVWRALKPRYGFLGHLVDFVPLGALAGLPPDKYGWAAGQHLVQVEASIIAQAMVRLTRDGVAVLPVHDSLIVTERNRAVAIGALESAFVEVAGVRPRVTS